MRAKSKLVCLVVLLLTGCDDRGLADPELISNDMESTALEGRLMFSNLDNKARIIDLSTGNVNSVPGVKAYGDESGREYASFFKAFAHAQPYSGDRFVLTLDSCKFDENDDSLLFGLDTCIAVHEADGTEIAVEKFYGWHRDIRGSAVMSFDGNYVAAVMNDHWVGIFDTDFNLISIFETPVGSLKGVVWRPDNSLLYYDNTEIFSTTPLDAAGTAILEMESDDNTDKLGTLKISPDGKTLAFQFGGELYLMDLSTQEIRLVPVVEELKLLWCNVTSWSPDGGHLMLYAKGTGLVLTWTFQAILGENIVIPVNFGLPDSDGNRIRAFKQVMAKTEVWRRGYDNNNASLEVLSENTQAYWLR